MSKLYFLAMSKLQISRLIGDYILKSLLVSMSQLLGISFVQMLSNRAYKQNFLEVYF